MAFLSTLGAIGSFASGIGSLLGGVGSLFGGSKQRKTVMPSGNIPTYESMAQMPFQPRPYVGGLSSLLGGSADVGSILARLLGG